MLMSLTKALDLERWNERKALETKSSRTRLKPGQSPRSSTT